MQKRPGARPLGENRCEFSVWAPAREKIEVHLLSKPERWVNLKKNEEGEFSGVIEDVPIGARYFFRLDERVERPDPASRSQPDGVHGPSEVIDLAHDFSDFSDFRNPPLSEYLCYEIHVGTFSKIGTFHGVIAELERLCDLGVTAIELMPVAQFPGKRNWGYDGAYPFCVAEAYGGARGLLALVEAAHACGLAVVLDVVYNHFGPEGNYIADFGPYFTDRYQTPWGSAINFDGPQNEGVRHFFIENALQWLEDFHVDALRLDAIHAIYDESPRPFLRELSDRFHARAKELGRNAYLIAERDLNDRRWLDLSKTKLDAMWRDDLHHAVHTLVTGERDGYYAEFGKLEDLERSWKTCSEPGVVFAQNHDQIGNRAFGDRLTTMLDDDTLKLTAGAVLLSPFIPLLFMGEEYAEDAPFLYFVNHRDPALVAAVRKGRKEEFRRFDWTSEPPDPQSPETFSKSKLDPLKKDTPRGREFLSFYKKLIAFRKKLPPGCAETKCDKENQLFCARRSLGENDYFLVFNFHEAPQTFDLPEGDWEPVLSSKPARDEREIAARSWIVFSRLRRSS